MSGKYNFYTSTEMKTFSPFHVFYQKWIAKLYRAVSLFSSRFALNIFRFHFLFKTFHPFAGEGSAPGGVTNTGLIWMLNSRMLRFCRNQFLKLCIWVPLSYKRSFKNNSKIGANLNLIHSLQIYSTNKSY